MPKLEEEKKKKSYNNEKDELVESEYYTLVAKRLVEKFPGLFKHINVDKIVFMEDNKRKTKGKLAYTKLVNRETRAVNGDTVRYYIVFLNNNLENASEAKKTKICFHELLHVGPEMEGVVRHDIEDFHLALKKLGLDYIDDDKDLLAPDFKLS